MPQPSAHRVLLAAKHKGRSGSSTQDTSQVLVEEQKKPRYMLQCSQLAHPCSLDDLILFNDVGKQCAELWIKMV